MSHAISNSICLVFFNWTTWEFMVFLVDLVFCCENVPFPKCVQFYRHSSLRSYYPRPRGSLQNAFRLYSFYFCCFFGRSFVRSFASGVFSIHGLMVYTIFGCRIDFVLWFEDMTIYFICSIAISSYIFCSIKSNKYIYHMKCHFTKLFLYFLSLLAENNK